LAAGASLSARRMRYKTASSVDAVVRQFTPRVASGQEPWRATRPNRGRHEYSHHHDTRPIRAGPCLFYNPAIEAKLRGPPHPAPRDQTRIGDRLLQSRRHPSALNPGESSSIGRFLHPDSFRSSLRRPRSDHALLCCSSCFVQIRFWKISCRPRPAVSHLMIPGWLVRDSSLLRRKNMTFLFCSAG
jgi:hypothetical protein